jgi:hypothetical protein
VNGTSNFLIEDGTTLALAVRRHEEILAREARVQPRHPAGAVWPMHPYREEASITRVLAGYFEPTNATRGGRRARSSRHAAHTLGSGARATGGLDRPIAARSWLPRVRRGCRRQAEGPSKQNGLALSSRRSPLAVLPSTGLRRREPAAYPRQLLTRTASVDCAIDSCEVG